MVSISPWEWLFFFLSFLSFFPLFCFKGSTAHSVNSFKNSRIRSYALVLNDTCFLCQSLTVLSDTFLNIPSNYSLASVRLCRENWCMNGGSQVLLEW